MKQKEQKKKSRESKTWGGKVIKGRKENGKVRQKGKNGQRRNLGPISFLNP